MKTQKYARSLAPVLVLLVSLPCLARNSHTVTLEDSVSLGGVQIAPGVYKIAWESHSPEATVTVWKGKQVVATAQARWVERNAKFTRTAFVYSISKDGSRRIMEIRLAGMHQALVFDPNAATGPTALTIPACATVSLAGGTALSQPAGGRCVQFVAGPTLATRRSIVPGPLDAMEYWPFQPRRVPVMPVSIR